MKPHSDDLPWCKKELGTGLDAVYVDWNRKNDSYLDMQFMTLCDRLVISNSTFSWWGAWLGANPGRFVASPDRWEILTSDMRAHILCIGGHNEKYHLVDR
jgi:hypothetical protein